MQAQKKVHFQQKAWVNTIMCLVSFWYWRLFNSLLSLILRLGLPTPFFLDSEDSFACFFSLVRRCWASLFSLDSPLSFTLLHFSYSFFSNHSFFFSSGIWVKDFCFLLICCVWFLLFLKGKCSIFGLSWTFCKSLQGFQFLQW